MTHCGGENIAGVPRASCCVVARLGLTIVFDRTLIMSMIHFMIKDEEEMT